MYVYMSYVIFCEVFATLRSIQLPNLNTSGLKLLQKRQSVIAGSGAVACVRSAGFHGEGVLRRQGHRLERDRRNLEALFLWWRPVS